MPTSAKDVIAKKMEDATNCAPATQATNKAKGTTATTPSEHTHLGLDMPPLATNRPAKGPRVRPDQEPYVQGKMTKKKTGRNVAIGAAVLGGLAAGAYALYKGGSNSDPTPPSPSATRSPHYCRRARPSPSASARRSTPSRASCTPSGVSSRTCPTS